jgi:hypothetical protein
VELLPWLGTYPASLDAAMTLLQAGHPTVAVNRRFIVAGAPNTDKRMYYLDGTLAATSYGGRVVPHCDEYTAGTLFRMLGGRFDVV